MQSQFDISWPLLDLAHIYLKSAIRGYRVYFKKLGRTVILPAGGDKRTQTAHIKRAMRLARNL